MKIYLDNCSLQRPLDDKTQTRIRLEAEAITEVLLLCESGELELVSSEILVLEIARMPNPKRRALTLNTLSLAGDKINLNDEIENRAIKFEKDGLKAFDALHLATAEFGKVDFFCTSDDKILKKTERISDLKIKVVSPLKLVEEVTK